MSMRLWGAMTLLFAGLLLCGGSAVADPQLPPRTGAVVDAANIIQPYQEQTLSASASNLKAMSNVELVVVTLPSLQGHSIERWGRELGNGWNVGGSTGRGILLIVAPNDREVRIEVGRGSADRLTDDRAAAIIRDVIVPRFKNGDRPGGISAGVDAIVVTFGGVESDFQPSRRERVGQWLTRWGAPLLFGSLILLFLPVTLLRHDQGERYHSNSNGGWARVDDDDNDDRNSDRDKDRSSGSRSDRFSGRGASGRW